MFSFFLQREKTAVVVLEVFIIHYHTQNRCVCALSVMSILKNYAHHRDSVLAGKKAYILCSLPLLSKVDYRERGSLQVLELVPSLELAELVPHHSCFLHCLCQRSSTSYYSH